MENKNKQFIIFFSVFVAYFLLFFIFLRFNQHVTDVNFKNTYVNFDIPSVSYSIEFTKIVDGIAPYGILVFSFLSLAFLLFIINNYSKIKIKFFYPLVTLFLILSFFGFWKGVFDTAFMHIFDYTYSNYIKVKSLGGSYYIARECVRDNDCEPTFYLYKNINSFRIMKIGEGYPDEKIWDFPEDKSINSGQIIFYNKTKYTQDRQKNFIYDIATKTLSPVK